ncbi:hypothetical protein K488DRAFT_69959 [Vararia minispora EC-137]|uniref:Uncharacterized protein n=1 Tax=Vararia minispora EC-137 TaxID=1314806 RepID=A0ACB8QNU7_9AGAM|nr:hypothetical protein K488DRAFT_69959 [Vararia minispora EC-137]
MFAFSALLSFALAATATTVPMKRTVQCFPPDSTLSQITKFNMTAFTTDGEDHLSASYPLTIGPATRSGGLDVLATVDSFPGATASLFTMQNSAIATLASDGVTAVQWDNNITGPSSFLSFSPASAPAASAEIYCVAISTSMGSSGLPWALFLEIGADSGNFQLCETVNGLNAVIYNLEQNPTNPAGIEYPTCFPVSIGITEQ